jgi:hypothetical protein
MSGREKGRQPLIEERFTVDMTATSKKALRKELEGHAGSGRRKNIVILPNINPNSLIKLDDIPGDSLCLFRAINILVMKKLLSKNAFCTYLNHIERQTREVRNMLRICQIPLDLDRYSVEKFGYIFIYNMK